MNESNINDLRRALGRIEDVLSDNSLDNDEWNELFKAVKPFLEYCGDKGIEE